MAHKEQRDFCKSVKARRPRHFKDCKVLDCGSLDINGSNKPLFDDCDYIGADLGEGKNVDIISTLHTLPFADEHFDTIISTECFEHDRHFIGSLKNITRMLSKGGLFIFTCATTGRREHGTTRTSPADAPFTNDYYMNITESDIRAVLNVGSLFSDYQFSEVHTTHDLQFWGVKK